MNQDITIELAEQTLKALSPENIDTTNQDKIIFDSAFGKLHIFKEELIDYRDIKNLITQQVETNIFVPGYYEQAVEFHGRIALRGRLFRESDSIELNHLQSNIKVEFSPISTNFCLKICECDNIPRGIRRYFHPGTRFREPSPDGTHLRELFSKIVSIKVIAPRTYSNYANSKQLRILSESSLFNLSYTYSISLIPIKAWQKNYYFLERDRNETAQFPLKSYNHELVAYYQMALGAESLILSYLALYKILEYFFTSASEKILHEKIKEQIVAPDFSHTKTNKLRELAKTIRRYDQKMDERKMLQTVIDEYIDSEQLKSWIEAFDAQNENYLTTEREVFNEKQKVDTSNSQLYATVGSRIYSIRNALVHNKEGELSRFTPFSGQETTLSKETPILKYIAEVLIIKSAKDIGL